MRLLFHDVISGNVLGRNVLGICVSDKGGTGEVGGCT